MSISCTRCPAVITNTAADEIRRLQEEAERLREAITYAQNGYDAMIWGEDYEYVKAGQRVQEILNAALTKKEAGDGQG